MSYAVERDVRVPMRDGVSLATDIWRPSGPEQLPVLLVRLPYGKNVVPGMFSLPTVPSLYALLDAGYAVVWQDCRGTAQSDGDFTPLVDEPHDGADTVSWLRQQPWCNGSVGSYGPSYLGFTQWATAGQAPAGLNAIASTFTTTDHYSAPWYSDGGAMSYQMAWGWATAMGIRNVKRDLAGGTGRNADLENLTKALGAENTELMAAPKDHALVPSVRRWWSDWTAHTDRDDYWQKRSVADHSDQVLAPALNIGGWFDIFVNQTARTFVRMKHTAGSDAARSGQRLIIGPWDHLDQSGVYHDRQFGPTASALAADLSNAHLCFFDRWVKGRADALNGTTPVRIFVMGIDTWRDEQDWPLPDTRYIDYHLGADGSATTAAGHGTLSPEPPTDERVDAYTYDPADPVPTRGGRIQRPVALNGVGPVDQTPVENRPDVLCFTTPILREPLEVTGHVTLSLFVTTSAIDTDFTGKLVDVHPDGSALYLTDGVLRTRFRTSLERPQPMIPHEIYEITVDLSVTSNVFLPGHRMRLEVSSSNFPRFDRNPNTGVSPTDLSAPVIAHNRVLHGPEHPSRLTLPVIDRDSRHA